LTRCSCDIFGTAGALLISEQDEAQLGSEFNTHLRTNDTAKAEYPIFIPKTADDLIMQNYILGLCDSVWKAIPADEKPEYKFTFTLLDKDVANAFAVPGGYVYIYTGMLKQMQDESELVGVIGHEIAHVTRHHYRNAMAKQAGLSILIQALVDDNSGAITQLVAQTFGSLAVLGVSRENESEADHYGTQYAGAMKRNPLGIAKFFARFNDNSFDWFSTHPAPEKRVETVTAQVDKSSVLKALATNSSQTDYKDRFITNTKPLRK